MKQFDDNFGSWCEAKGLNYTRYCDDITVSGDSSLYSAYRKASRWLTGMGFEINERKTHFLSNANRQTVTGLTVNEKISIPSDYKRKVRQELYYAQKFGIENVIIHKGLADFIIGGKADIGICICGTGVGINNAANRIGTSKVHSNYVWFFCFHVIFCLLKVLLKIVLRLSIANLILFFHSANKKVHPNLLTKVKNRTFLTCIIRRRHFLMQNRF